MLGVPPELARLYDTRLEHEDVAAEHRPPYRKWLHFYWDFCHKYSFEPTDRQSFPAFDEKLRTKNQSEAQRKQAYHATRCATFQVKQLLHRLTVTARDPVGC